MTLPGEKRAVIFERKPQRAWFTVTVAATWFNPAPWIFAAFYGDTPE